LSVEHARELFVDRPQYRLGQLAGVEGQPGRGFHQRVVERQPGAQFGQEVDDLVDRGVLQILQVVRVLEHQAGGVLLGVRRPEAGAGPGRRTRRRRRRAR
jgi:hypothetical protein